MTNCHYIYTCIVLSLILINGNHCDAVSQCPARFGNNRYNEALNYARLSSLYGDSNRKYNARMILDNCTFGREQSLSHILDLRYCFDHCSMRDACVAINMEEDHCRFCYNGTHTLNSAVVDPDKLYMHLAKLGRYRLHRQNNSLCLL